jgi:hypothetical protein
MSKQVSLLATPFAATTQDYSRLRNALIDKAVELDVLGGVVSPEEFQIMCPGAAPFVRQDRPVYQDGCTPAQDRSYAVKYASYEKEMKNFQLFRQFQIADTDDTSKAGMATENGTLHGRSEAYMLAWMDNKFLTLSVADAKILYAAMDKMTFSATTMTAEIFVFELKKGYKQLEKSGVPVAPLIKCEKLKEAFANIPAMTTTIEIWDVTHGTIALQDFDDLSQVVIVKYNQIKHQAIASVGYAAAAAAAAVAVTKKAVKRPTTSNMVSMEKTLHYCHTCGGTRDHNGWSCPRPGPNHRPDYTTPAGTGPWPFKKI